MLEGIEVFIAFEALVSIPGDVARKQWIATANTGPDTLTQDDVLHFFVCHLMLSQIVLCCSDAFEVEHFAIIVLQVFKAIDGHAIDTAPNNDRFRGLLDQKTRSLQNRDTQFLRFHDLGAHAAADPVAVDNQAGTHC